MRLALLSCLVLFAYSVARPQAPFLVKPYLQLGDAPQATDGRLDLLWHTAEEEHVWSVSFKAQGEKDWRQAKPAFVRVAVPTVEPHRVYSVTLAPLKPGLPFDYRVSRNGKAAFEYQGLARKTTGQPQRVALAGDIAWKGAGHRAIAYQISKLNPDYTLVPGDIVYPRGRIPEYREVFFPVYNADEASPAAGAPLLRHSVWIGNLGNHDVEFMVKAKYSDTLAYYLYWNQPLNGPALSAGGPHTPELYPFKDWQPFLQAAGPRFPRMGSFSFDIGAIHWTVLDTDPYVNWEDPALRAWLEKDLAQASRATWRFVVLHHQGFHSSRAHAKDQWTRLLSPVFEKHEVDLVIGGHIHNYQRSLPLRFQPAPEAASRLNSRLEGEVPGEFTLDREFDGKTRTRAKGIIYIVTGAGGAVLYDTGQGAEPQSWKPFTAAFVSDRYSFSALDIDGKRLDFRQIDAEGRTVDSFTLTKP